MRHTPEARNWSRYTAYGAWFGGTDGVAGVCGIGLIVAKGRDAPGAGELDTTLELQPATSAHIAAAVTIRLTFITNPLRSLSEQGLTHV
jgi:hypothetical protein